METFDFWQELKKSWNLIVNHPQIILVTLIPSLLIAISNYLTWQGHLAWISIFFQEAGSLILLILGIFLSFIALALITAIVWDYRYQGAVDLRRAWKIVQKRLPDVAMVSLIMGFLGGFFAAWFLFLGLLLAFLLLFTIPLTVVEGDNPFSAIRNSFHLVTENPGECFTFFILLLFFLLVGYLLFWLLGFLGIAGLVLNTITGGIILAYVFLLLSSFYFYLTRF
ncbi:MAG TPA: hypothetical protein PLJ96_02360 [Candidatus Atribacteria bacterium]|nr:hypothetical protein [Candidatus Atribacteria bacterium]